MKKKFYNLGAGSTAFSNLGTNSMLFTDFRQKLYLGLLMRLNKANFEVWTMFLLLDVFSALEEIF